VRAVLAVVRRAVSGVLFALAVAVPAAAQTQDTGTYSAPALDWGAGPGIAWVHFNGDGKADYCRLTGTAPSDERATCTTTISLKPLVKKRLKAGTVIKVTVTKPGSVAAHKTLRVRAGKRPRVSHDDRARYA
jgi:hypothetical protein